MEEKHAKERKEEIENFIEDCNVSLGKKIYQVVETVVGGLLGCTTTTATSNKSMRRPPFSRPPTNTERANIDDDTREDTVGRGFGSELDGTDHVRVCVTLRRDREVIY